MVLKVVRPAAGQWPAEFPPAAQAPPQDPAACTHCLRDSKTARICHWRHRETSCECNIRQNTSCKSPFVCQNEAKTS